jgi:hypothetical protein
MMMSMRANPAAASVPPHGAGRGFTLVELMVALSGGLFLSIVVFALARDSSRFFQREGRMASATLAGMVGFERLKADIERAGYLSTPNIAADPNVCPGAPAGLMTLAGLRITPDTPDLSGNGAFALNAASGRTLTPDQIVLSGSYAATDEFPTSDPSSGQNIFLQTNMPAMARLGYLTASGSSAQLALLQNVFGASAGQILRYRDSAGLLYFGQIATVTAGATPFITLSNVLPVKSSATAGCGVTGGPGGSANVVNIVRYRVMDLQNDTAGATWAPLFAASQGADGETTRTELVRDQLTADGTPIPGTTDVVAEYAVDLSFEVTGQLTAGLAALTTTNPSDPATFSRFFALNATGDRPQGVRSVRVRLSVRSREADRTANIPGAFYRFQVGPTSWARVRTFQADVALPNQASLTW